MTEIINRKYGECMSQQPDQEMLLASELPHTAVAAQLGVNEKTVRRMRKKMGWVAPVVTDAVPVADEILDAEDREALHSRLDEIIDRGNTGDVKAMKVGTWDTTTKDNEGQAVQTRNYKVELVSTANVEPKWPVVQRSPLSVSVLTSSSAQPARRNDQSRVAVILPDTQIGYRRLSDGTLDPFHDEQAIDVALQITAHVNPDRIIWLGDFLDLAPFGRFEQEATFARTTQAAVDYGYTLLAKAATLAPYATQTVLEGNHDRRLEKAIVANAVEAFGLRQAHRPKDWPVLSVPNLLRFDELGIEYIEGYPAGATWINERIKCVHGSTVRSNGSTAKAVVDEERTSVIFGHIHRIESHYKTSETYNGGRVRIAHTPGCLCRIDGAVPSVKSSTDLSGRPVTHHENWQNGLAVVSYGEGDAPFNIEQIFISTFEGYTASFGGHLFTPSVAG